MSDELIVDMPQNWWMWCVIWGHIWTDDGDCATCGALRED